MYAALGITPAEKTTGNKKNKSKDTANNGNDNDDAAETAAILAAEKKLTNQGLRTDKFNLSKNEKDRSEDLPISRNTTKRVENITKALTANSVEKAATASASAKENRYATDILAIFRQKNQDNINFYDDLRAQSNSLADAKPLPTTVFFHQAKRPDYQNFKKQLLDCGFKIVSHGVKDHVCWKVAGKFHHFAVDRPHGAQLEMGKSVGWFLRSQQKIEASGLR